MKKKLLALVLLMMALSACSANESGNEITENDMGSDISQTSTRDDDMQPKKFSEYTFAFRGTKENYMIVVRKAQHENEISVTVENNQYRSREYIITVPDGYRPVFPLDQQNASSVVNVITNDIDDTYIPDIMQFSFDPIINDNEKMSETMLQKASRMYTVNDKGELREIGIYKYADNDGDGEKEEQVMDHLDRSQLYHSEPAKFIYEISVDSNTLYDDEGELLPIDRRVKIQTLAFDVKELKMVLDYERISEDNPLYFGYAYWSAANSVAQYFTMTIFNISDWENYIEMPNEQDSSYTDYYFMIDDSRFDDMEGLIGFTETVFTEKLAKQLIEASPQKYCDIDGKLYAIAGDGGYDASLGLLTFSGMDISEDKMMFRSRQEKYDDKGKCTGYTDGGTFVIIRDEDNNWKVSTYRYPYSE